MSVNMNQERKQSLSSIYADFTTISQEVVNREDTDIDKGVVKEAAGELFHKVRRDFDNGLLYKDWAKTYRGEVPPRKLSSWSQINQFINQVMKFFNWVPDDRTTINGKYMEQIDRKVS